MAMQLCTLLMFELICPPRWYLGDQNHGAPVPWPSGKGPKLEGTAAIVPTHGCQGKATTVTHGQAAI